MPEYRIQRLALNDLDPLTRNEYALFLHPRFRCALNGVDPDGVSDTEIIAIGVTCEELPVGIALASVYDPLGMCEVFSLFLLKEHRSESLGLELLKALESACIAAKGNVLVQYYLKGTTESAFLETIHSKSAWGTPKPFMLRCFYDCFNFNPPWYEKPPALPSAFQEFKWNQLRKKEREQLEKDLKQSRIHTSVNPLSKKLPFEPLNSLGLRYRDRVIGWMITHRIAPDIIRYSALYVEPEYAFKGYSIRLLVDAIKLQQHSSVKWSLFEVNLGEVDKSWIKFVSKRLMPYAQHVDVVYQGWKAIPIQALPSKK